MPRPARPMAAPVVALVLTVACVLAACGGSPSTGRSPAQATSTAPAAPAPTDLHVVGGSVQALPAELDVTAEGLAFTPAALAGPAGTPLTIRMANRDAEVPHNIAIRAGLPVSDVAPNTPDLFIGEIVAGPVVKAYAVPGLPAGAYTFFCQVHPNMVGTLTLR